MLLFALETEIPSSFFLYGNRTLASTVLKDGLENKRIKLVHNNNRVVNMPTVKWWGTWGSGEGGRADFVASDADVRNKKEHLKKTVL